MPRKADEHHSLPVMVPRNKERLVPVLPDRTRQLEAHLRECLSDLAKVKRAQIPRRSPAPQSDGFDALVARTACTLCRGFCCWNGDNTGFLDVATLARVRREKPELSDEGVVALYLDRVPSDAYRGSCIFHGKRGCTLDRSIRTDVCNVSAIFGAPVASAAIRRAWIVTLQELFSSVSRCLAAKRVHRS